MTFQAFFGLTEVVLSWNFKFHPRIPRVLWYLGDFGPTTGPVMLYLYNTYTYKHINRLVGKTLKKSQVPIYRRGKIASFKTSYSGAGAQAFCDSSAFQVVRVGYPPQDWACHMLILAQ